MRATVLYCTCCHHCARMVIQRCPHTVLLFACLALGAPFSPVFSFLKSQVSSPAAAGALLSSAAGWRDRAIARRCAVPAGSKRGGTIRLRQEPGVAVGRGAPASGVGREARGNGGKLLWDLLRQPRGAGKRPRVCAPPGLDDQAPARQSLRLRLRRITRWQPSFFFFFFSSFFSFSSCR